MVGYLISLEKILKERGFTEIDEEFLPKVDQVLPGVLPRAVAGYAMLMWFTSKVCVKILW